MFKQENFLLEKLSKLWDYFYIKLPFHLWLWRQSKKKVSCLFQMKKVQAGNETMPKTQSNKNLGNTEERTGNRQAGKQSDTTKD